MGMVLEDDAGAARRAAQGTKGRTCLDKRAPESREALGQQLQYCTNAYTTIATLSGSDSVQLPRFESPRGSGTRGGSGVPKRQQSGSAAGLRDEASAAAAAAAWESVGLRPHTNITRRQRPGVAQHGPAWPAQFSGTRRVGFGGGRMNRESQPNGHAKFA